MFDLVKRIGATLALGMFMGAGSAAASVAVPGVVATGATGGPGGTAITEATLTLAPGFVMENLTFIVDWNNPRLSFNRASAFSTVSIDGETPIALATFDSTGGLSGVVDPITISNPIGIYTLSGVLDVPRPVSTIVFRTVFDIAASPTTAGLGTVNYLITPGDGVGIPEDYSGSVSINISAVPEPENWALLLAGLGIIGATVRRRAARV